MCLATVGDSPDLVVCHLTRCSNSVGLLFASFWSKPVPVAAVSLSFLQTKRNTPTDTGSKNKSLGVSDLLVESGGSSFLSSPGFDLN